MVEVTRKNFENLLPEIAGKIGDATFIAVDAEYTGLFAEDLNLSKSLFDSGPQRYTKAANIASKFITCQYGLSIFRKDREENIYRVEAYNFYLFPVAFDAFGKRDVTSIQNSCIHFLARHGFSFDKVFKEGIPFLNKEKAESLRSFLKSNRHFMRTSEYLDEYYFPTKISLLTDEDIEDIINRLAGFSKIIDVIKEVGVPVVGHNCFTDLLMTYNQFWENLPESYSKFKSCVHDLFPTIYDTKYLSREVQNLRRSENPDDKVLCDSNLFALYSNTYSIFEMNMPLIETVGETKKYFKVLLDGRRQNLETLPDHKASCHSADFDSLITGCVFLNLCYLASRPTPKPLYQRDLPPTFSELIGRTECWSNKINIARAYISYMNLAGPDPEPHRPNWILAKSVNGKHFDPVQLKMDFVKHGDLEIIKLSDVEVIIACSNNFCHRMVWKDLKQRGCQLTEKCLSDGIFASGLGKRLVFISVSVAAVAIAIIGWLKYN